MNESLKSLIKVSEELSFEVLEFKIINYETDLPRARVRDTKNNVVLMIEYKDNNWNEL